MIDTTVDDIEVIEQAVFVCCQSDDLTESSFKFNNLNMA
jgi:hypothetical protein